MTQQRIRVLSENGRREFTYLAPDDVQVGDEVLLPAARAWEDVFPERWATVVGLGSDYEGSCLTVREVRKGEV